MIFSQEVTRIIIFLLGIAGFMVAKHIRNHKKTNAPLVCMVGFDCHAVVHSDYSKFMGAPVEVVGMVYYGFVTLISFFFIFLGNTVPNFMVGISVVISLVAFLFSLYLIGVQLFALKKGCSWCLVSALISILIFILVFSMYDLSAVAQIFAR